MPLLTIGRLARRHGISRAAILHYEALGLLPATARDLAGYRYYDEAAQDRLRQIRIWREAGLDMEAIRRLLADAKGMAAEVLEGRLAEVNRQIAMLRDQQRAIVRMLAVEGGPACGRAMTKEQWVALLAAAGLDEAAMTHWHALFEASAPEAHQDFLESLGIPGAEIATIRDLARRHDAS